jgi:serine/threonine protein kinase
MEIPIQLPHGAWFYNDEKLLGEGGFGAVYIGKDGYGTEVAVKRLSFTARQSAVRELRIAEKLLNANLNNVIQILDAGQDANSDYYYIIMPLATENLQNQINRDGVFEESMAVQILLNIAKGLLEVQDITHRDLKPSNILFHEVSWKISDFGIARFVEEVTSKNTVSEHLSPEYAAPEQWQSERATSKTDIYALGCIAVTLLTGNPPFHNLLDRSAYKTSHLTESPTIPNTINPRFRSLILTMLRKSVEGRPNINRVLEVLTVVLDEIQEGAKKRVSLLAEVGATHVERLLQEESEAQRARARWLAREKLATYARNQLTDNFSELTRKIKADVPIGLDIYDRGIRFGNAYLTLQKISLDTLAINVFPESRWDVLLGEMINVVQRSPNDYIWSANLWYAKLPGSNDYRWYEVSYFNVGKSKSDYAPFAVEDFRDADLAASNIMHSVAFATKPKPIDDENMDEFHDRWMELFAKAYKGDLKYPESLPLE